MKKLSRGSFCLLTKPQPYQRPSSGIAGWRGGWIARIGSEGTWPALLPAGPVPERWNVKTVFIETPNGQRLAGRACSHNFSRGPMARGMTLALVLISARSRQAAAFGQNAEIVTCQRRPGAACC